MEKVEFGVFSPLVSSVHGGLGAVIRRAVGIRQETRAGDWGEKMGREVFVEKTRVQMGILRVVAERTCVLAIFLILDCLARCKPTRHRSNFPSPSRPFLCSLFPMPRYLPQGLLC